jgi:hypothetical protein
MQKEEIVSTTQRIYICDKCGKESTDCNLIRKCSVCGRDLCNKCGNYKYYEDFFRLEPVRTDCVEVVCNDCVISYLNSKYYNEIMKSLTKIDTRNEYIENLKEDFIKEIKSKQ